MKFRWSAASRAHVRQLAVGFSGARERGKSRRSPEVRRAVFAVIAKSRTRRVPPAWSVPSEHGRYRDNFPVNLRPFAARRLAKT